MLKVTASTIKGGADNNNNNNNSSSSSSNMGGIMSGDDKLPSRSTISRNSVQTAYRSVDNTENSDDDEDYEDDDDVGFDDGIMLDDDGIFLDRVNNENMDHDPEQNGGGASSAAASRRGGGRRQKQQRRRLRAPPRGYGERRGCWNSTLWIVAFVCILFSGIVIGLVSQLIGNNQSISNLLSQIMIRNSDTATAINNDETAATSGENNATNDINTIQDDSKNDDNDNAATIAAMLSSAMKESNDKNSYESRTIHYDSSTIASLTWNPYDIQMEDNYNNNLIIPSISSLSNYDHDENDNHNNDMNDVQGYGYIRHPDIVNNTVVFSSEGDLYWSRLDDSITTTDIKDMPAIKLTTTVGNVLYPKINPIYPYLIAYRATYQDRSEIYLLDLRNKSKQKTTQRLTYLDGVSGINSIIGWKADGKSLLFSSYTLEVGLLDERVYELAVLPSTTSDKTNNINNKNEQQQLHALEIKPIPLAEAVEGVWSSNSNEDDECFYFVRHRQQSHTARYIGGTAESIWAYCTGEDVSVHITHNYNGTSKHPQILTLSAGYNNNQQSNKFLLFMSDRSLRSETNEWFPATMNLWAMPLPTRSQLYPSTSGSDSSSSLKYNNTDPSTYVQLTYISCQFNGMALQEYALDQSRKQAIVRVGADLYHIPASDIQSKLVPVNSKRTTTNKRPNRLPIHVLSDFHEQQERLIPVDFNTHITGADVFDMSFGSTSILLTLRGQVWVVPIIEDWANYADPADYDGAGRNIPQRRYRVVPGAMTGGAIRVLNALNVPLYVSSSSSPSSSAAGQSNGTASPSDTEDGEANGTTTTENDEIMNTTSGKTTTTATPKDDARRLSLLLATDPDSPTAEHAFYLIEVQSDSINSFTNLQRLPKPFLGGSVSGGPTKTGGLGSILSEKLVISPCGRRFAWADTDNRICAMTMPIYLDTGYMNKSSSNNYSNSFLMMDEEGAKNSARSNTKFEYHCLPSTNENDEPMAGSMSDFQWSPGGRYLAVSHSARNQFNIISIVDLGDPEPGPDDEPGAVIDIQIGRAVQATPSRFNCYDPYWGISTFDVFLGGVLSATGYETPSATTLYFLSDRDVITDVASPWGSRSPSPHFPRLESHVYALPLTPNQVDATKGSENDEEYVVADVLLGRFAGGGAMEIYSDAITKYTEELTLAAAAAAAAATDENERRLRRLKNVSETLTKVLKTRRLSSHERNVLVRYLQSMADSRTAPDSPFPKDMNIYLGGKSDMRLPRTAYRISHIPKSTYKTILAQSPDGSLLLVESSPISLIKTKTLIYYSLDPFPGDVASPDQLSNVMLYGLSTDRRYVLATNADRGRIRVASTSMTGLTGFMRDRDWQQFRADSLEMALSVWPKLEYEQMYNDAWRMLRDYFYDENLHGVNWDEIHTRYKGLVQRCAKREELDDVLGQMISELSYLHAFVYGGEYNSPETPKLEPAFLGVTLKRVPEWKGYMITQIPEPDPDFGLIDNQAVYSPLSDQTLRLTGQRGLKVGDVIIGIQGESVMQGSDLNMHLRGMAGRSVRLEVLRLKSGKKPDNTTITQAIPEPLLVVPIDSVSGSILRYNAWEWKTRQKAKELASKEGFSVGYIHMQAMNSQGEDAFARGYYPDYDKDALIIDVRHNSGGNIDSWILSMLQRTAWSFWSGRGVDQRNGDMDWDEQMAFRGKVVVLIDAFTASNGEGFSRGFSELGLGKLIGERTWGGGIWGSNVNHLVDGGIAAAAQWGVFNEKWGWGLGVEMTGVSPDIEVVNDPHMSYLGKDSQLERAIAELKEMLAQDPVAKFKVPGDRPDMSVPTVSCPI